jgi:hypothetical protein
MEAIFRTLCALTRRFIAATAATSSPSPYGPYIDAVARRGVFLAILADVDRVQAKLAALKARLVAGYPEMPSSSQLLSVPRRMM